MSKNTAMANNKTKRVRHGSLWFDILNYTVLFIIALAMIYPFWDTIIKSFADSTETVSLGFRLWNDSWSLTSYKYILGDGRILTAYQNTIIRTIVTTVLMMCTTMLAAYPLSKKDLPGRNIFTIYFLITMFFSGGLIPSYLLMKSLGLLNSLAVLILPSAFSVYNMIIVRNYLMSLDNALEEAAFIEGAGYFTVLTKIMVPLSKPVLATIALWAAVGSWNAWFDAMIYNREGRLMVLQQFLRTLVADTQSAADAQSLRAFNQLNEQKIVTTSVQSAAIMLTIGPIILVYPFVQKHFVKGIMIGSLKG